MCLLKRRDTVGLVVVLTVVVVIVVGYLVASGYTPRAATPTPSDSASASASASASSALSAEEQALREAALAMPVPERPAGMDQFTPEGAIAAAEYFLSLYPYVYATGGPD